MISNYSIIFYNQRLKLFYCCYNIEVTWNAIIPSILVRLLFCLVNVHRNSEWYNFFSYVLDLSTKWSTPSFLPTSVPVSSTLLVRRVEDVGYRSRDISVSHLLNVGQHVRMSIRCASLQCFSLQPRTFLVSVCLRCYTSPGKLGSQYKYRCTFLETSRIMK